MTENPTEVVVRPACPLCGSMHVPAHKTVTIEEGRLYVTYRRCASCGHTYKQIEVALYAAKFRHGA